MRRLTSDLVNGAVLLVLALPWAPGPGETDADRPVQSIAVAATTADHANSTVDISRTAPDATTLGKPELSVARVEDAVRAGPSDDFYQANCAPCPVRQRAIEPPPRQMLAESASRTQAAASVTSVKSSVDAVVPRIARQRPKPVSLSINIDGGGSKRGRAGKKKGKVSDGKRGTAKVPVAKRARK